MADCIRRVSKLPHACIIDTGFPKFGQLLKVIESICGSVRNRRFILPMGEDVFDKLDLEDLDGYKCNIPVYPRNKVKDTSHEGIVVINRQPNEFSGISSTKIRLDLNN